jgi:hypothetical protein
MLGRPGWIVALALAAFACTFPNAGADGGATDAGSQTVGTQCDAIDLAYCTHGINVCGVFESLSQCIADQTAACCLGSACNAISRTPPAAVDACTAAIPQEDCNSTVTLGLAGVPSCQGIPAQ